MINPGEIQVLICEDEPDLRDLLAAKFRVFGFDVITSPNGNTAWDILLQNPNIQIIISDIRMPNGSGYELLQKCKERNPVFPRVFLISGFTDYSEAELFNLGSEGFISKPFDTKVLLSIVRKSLLSLSDRWRGQNTDIPESQIEFSEESLEKALDSKKLRFGRGGFCIETTQTLPLVGESIAFKLQVSPWMTHGTGRVRWKNPGKNSESSQEAGIEITSLEGAHREEVINWILKEKFQAYIPNLN